MIHHFVNGWSDGRDDWSVYVIGGQGTFFCPKCQK